MSTTIEALGAAAFFVAISAIPSLANDYTEFPVEPLAQSIPRSYPTGQLVGIPPYFHVFHVRTYTTPPQQPYYNVPPYDVVTPF